MHKLMMVTAFALATLGTASVASADLCRNVDIQIHNDFGKQIKVVDFDYWDNTEGKWREENFVDNVVVDNGDDHVITNRDLEYVGGEFGVKIRVQFKYMTANNGWSEEINASSASFHCDDGDWVNVFVNDIN